jgi:HPt (histidine-containing phosphotransfer) domain-containing protein
MQNVIDTVYIDEFLGIAGSEPFFEAINLFEFSLQDYFKSCRNFFNKQNYAQAAKEMHKIKGAACSIGLKRLMIISKNYEIEIVEKESMAPLDKMIDEISKITNEDLEVLSEYIKKHQ